MWFVVGSIGEVLGRGLRFIGLVCVLGRVVVR